jgi:hypothetical protein
MNKKISETSDSIHFLKSFAVINLKRIIYLALIVINR